MRAWQRLERQMTVALVAHMAGRPLLVPEAGRLFWRWFVDLHRSRTYHAAGPHPIAYAEIEAYGRLHGWPLERRHVELIRALDAAWLNQNIRPTSQPAMLTAESFDAVLGSP